MSEPINVDVPTVGESISEVQIGQWLKAEGDWVNEGEDLVEIETEKASVQIPAPASGILERIDKASEAFATIGETIAVIQTGQKPPGTAKQSDASDPSLQSPQAGSGSANASSDALVMPAAQRLLDEQGLTAGQVPASGPGGRLLKEDVLAFVRQRSDSTGVSAPKTAPPSAKPVAVATAVPARATATTSLVSESNPNRSEEIKPLSMLRRTIAARLVEAQQTAALLTTFNEIDMQPTMAIRNKYKDAFAERHGVKLGFMSFFAKAAVDALRRFPAVNAEIRDDNVVYRHYQDIGIAIGGGKGLVVPVLRNVERMSFAGIETAISDFAKLAGENRLQPSDLMGGTFTISNGGIYGSLLSTPIVNPPQSGILGLHSIQDRPIAVDGEVVIRPMMYIALTYDHRIVDGREAVGFLRVIKEVIEDPARLFLEL
ncbi:2-oxoglutarate dehydrogenase complex dihydrolipoyllysine-residue succinyltransferase [Novipirellula artificiosorum]|uniref:Dihydrolipoyllysine-residue succinyltransferase component of 2-oxoglutarate dehydrogenase complex n=1 Tax=Novipirellula artificiosorum TaxID=2528016 RepID=A0A5C6DFL4_9BACT|nr:2-oxoglutarate dehydrogenase complex dihydrolipoyllysine-residue succinyltransferase [Novipirellula artificiosorum]TWU36053.1 Dihydrolipoyllysine-residue succinyltransferase component of 2-oxoglutarate dehydrogenase complex [Novipirellula artificiosorum]